MRVLMLLLTLLFVAACDLEFAGIRQVDEHAGRLASALRVGSVRCPEEVLSVGESMKCEALSNNGTRLSIEQQSLVVWSASTIGDTIEVVSIDLSGRVIGVAPGTAWVTARGSSGTSATFSVTVEDESDLD